jgi:hypothetical protein
VPFEFDSERRRQLVGDLKRDLQMPAVGSVLASSIGSRGTETAKHVATQIVDVAQAQIVLLLSAREDDQTTTPANAPSIRAAIGALREAIQPFREGWIDAATADIADWHAIEKALAKRDQALQSEPRRNPGEDARYNANLIFAQAHQIARLAGFDLAEDAALRFTAAVLEAAEVKCPNLDRGLARFRAFLDNA